jgi:hypothetical protein
MAWIAGRVSLPATELAIAFDEYYSGARSASLHEVERQKRAAKACSDDRNRKWPHRYLDILFDFRRFGSLFCSLSLTYEET